MLVDGLPPTGQGNTLDALTLTAEQGIYVGQGMAPVPRKLTERIWQWEFVDMGEMLSDNWLQKGDEPTVNPLGLARRKRQVTDINTWIWCFAMFTSVMSRKCPETVPELQAYMVPIMKASSEYSGLALAQYDSSPGCQHRKQKLVAHQPLPILCVLHRKGQQWPGAACAHQWTMP